MLDGVTPFPAEFAARYRDRGYWALFDESIGALARYADRAALVEGQGPVTYRQLGERSARVLLDVGLGPLPERLEFSDTLPLSGFGKVSKKDLAAVIR